MLQNACSGKLTAELKIYVNCDKNLKFSNNSHKHQINQDFIYLFSGFCSKCAIQLEICPLCRTAIEQVDNEHVSGSSSSTKNNRESDIHLRSQLSHDKSTEHVRPTSSRTSDDQSIK